MKTIKFRLWDIAGKKWFKSGSYEFNSGHSENEGKIVSITFGSKNARRGIEEFVIEQFTGLKDRKGREIYEGDIVRDTEDTLKKVVRGFGAFFLKNTIETQLCPCWLGRRDNKLRCYRIVGNIHENREFL